MNNFNDDFNNNDNNSDDYNDSNNSFNNSNNDNFGQQNQYQSQFNAKQTDYEVNDYKKPAKKNSVLPIILSSVLCLFVGGFFALKVLAPKEQEPTNSAALEAEKKEIEADKREEQATISNELPKIGSDKPLNLNAVSVPDIVDIAIDSVVGIGTDIGSGSGIIISDDGYIITNNHVISGANKIEVLIGAEKEEVDAKLIGTDPIRDVAVIKVEKTGLKAAVIGDSLTVRVGETVLAIGNPLSTLTGTVTQGIISAVNREVAMDNYTHTYLQTDAPINPGNSGGALVNLNGEVVGINTLKSLVAGYDATGNAISSEGIGFAIPINDAIEIAKELIQHGKYVRPGIGITARTIDIEEAATLRVPRGILVVDITPQGEAEKAGIRANDIITKIDGQDCFEMEDLSDAISTKKVGDILKVKVWRIINRSNQEVDIDITVGDMNEMNLLAEQAQKQQQQEREQDYFGGYEDFPWDRFFP